MLTSKIVQFIPVPLTDCLEQVPEEKIKVIYIHISV